MTDCILKTDTVSIIILLKLLFVSHVLWLSVYVVFGWRLQKPLYVYNITVVDYTNM